MLKYLCCIAAALTLAQAHSSHASSPNKTTAIDAMTDIFSKQDPSAVDRYFAAPYRQHNMWIPDGLDALRGVAKMATSWPDANITVIRAVEDKDLVVLHSAYWNLANGQQTAVAFDLFRFDTAGKIREHWDALEGFAGRSAVARSQYEGSTEVTDLDKTEANRQVVRGYVEAVLVGGKASKRARFVNLQAYTDHGVTEAVSTEMSKSGPFSTTKWTLADVRYVKPHRTLAEGNFVLVQGEGKLPNEQMVEIYDLFRVAAGKIVEHWDVHQVLAPPAKWANPNGPF